MLHFLHYINGTLLTLFASGRKKVDFIMPVEVYLPLDLIIGNI